MSIPELVAVIIGAPATLLLVQWIVGRGKSKREDKEKDLDLEERWERINNQKLDAVYSQLERAREEAHTADRRAAACQLRCDRYSELTLDILEMLATHGIDTDEFRARWRDIRSTAA